MSEKILLCLSARMSSIALMRRNRLQAYGAHEDRTQALQNLIDLMRRHPHAAVYLMVDSVDEEYRAESLPHVHAGARRQMLKRKLDQHFRTLSYRAAWLLGRESTSDSGKRRDDSYLFIALNNSDLLLPYLEAIHHHRAPLAGIYLLPQATQILVDQLPPANNGLLVVSRQHTGLRQSFFFQGRLRISRMTAIDPGHTPEADFYAEEIEKSRLFLYNSRHLPRDAHLTVYLIDMDGQMAPLVPLLRQDGNLNCALFGLRDLSTALNLSADSLPPDNAAMHLVLLGKHPPPASLAPSVDADFVAHRLRSGLFTASALIALVALIWSGLNVYRGNANQHETQRMLTETRQYQAQYDAAAQRFPAAPASAEHMQQAVEAAQQIRKLARTPEPVMLALSAALNEFPQIELVRLHWRHAPDLPSSTIAAVNEKSAQQAEIDAEIRPFSGDYRTALNVIEGFAASLRRLPSVVNVIILKLPVDLDPGSTLSGSTQDTPEARPGAAGFKLRMEMEAGA